MLFGVPGFWILMGATLIPLISAIFKEKHFTKFDALFENALGTFIFAGGLLTLSSNEIGKSITEATVDKVGVFFIFLGIVLILVNYYRVSFFREWGSARIIAPLQMAAIMYVVYGLEPLFVLIVFTFLLGIVEVIRKKIHNK
jgi:hypothetical protein